MNIRSFHSEWESRFDSYLIWINRCMKKLSQSGIMLSHTEGFNPHPKLSFGLPLPLGVTSDACYMDAVIEELISLDELVERLNKALPQGLKVFEAKIPEDKRAVMSLVSNARYFYRFCSVECSAEDLTAKIKTIFDQEDICIEKETKKKSKTVNIKDMMQEVDIRQEGDATTVKSCVRRKRQQLESSDESRLHVRQCSLGAFIGGKNPMYKKEMETVPINVRLTEEGIEVSDTIL